MSETKDGCINCGEPSATGGGYEVGDEEAGSLAGPFCASCFDEIEDYFTRTRGRWLRERHDEMYAALEAVWERVHSDVCGHTCCMECENAKTAMAKARGE